MSRQNADRVCHHRAFAGGKGRGETSPNTVVRGIRARLLGRPPLSSTVTTVTAWERDGEGRRANEGKESRQQRQSLRPHASLGVRANGNDNNTYTRVAQPPNVWAEAFRPRAIIAPRRSAGLRKPWAADQYTAKVAGGPVAKWRLPLGVNVNANAAPDGITSRRVTARATAMAARTSARLSPTPLKSSVSVRPPRGLRTRETSRSGRLRLDPSSSPVRPPPAPNRRFSRDHYRFRRKQQNASVSSSLNGMFGPR